MIWHRRLKLIQRQRNSQRKRAASRNYSNYSNGSNGSSMDHSHSEDQLWGAVEILPQRLYYAPLKFFPPETEEGGDGAGNKPVHYFSIDNELIYWNFFLDFGPLNLGQLYRFCAKLNAKLSSPQYKDAIVCYYSSAKGQARANAAFLICAWSMLYLGRSLDESYFGFREEFADGASGGGSGGDGDDDARMEERGSDNTSLPPRSSRSRRSPSTGSSSSRSRGEGEAEGDDARGERAPSPFARLHPLPPFHDASPIVCTYDLTVHDCLRGLDKARRLGFFKFGNAPPPAPGRSSPSTTTLPPARDPPDFDPDEYEHFEQVENGDLNWIVRDKILAFAGPQRSKVVTPEGFCALTPGDYIPYFRRNNVGLVVRLNKKCYDESDFERAGMRHVEHYYLDGSCPPLEILRAVVSDMEDLDEGAAMAVHCKAGLGRTGTCIGAYLMKHYRFTAREVIGWMRIARPGMVIGPQQHFLEDIEGLMWREGEAMRDGPRRMAVEGEEEGADDDDDDAARTPARKASAAAATSPAPAAATAGGPGGAVVSVVTPDGKPLRLPATPVVARKLDLKRDAADMMAAAVTTVSPPPVSPATPGKDEGRPLHSTPSSTGSLPSTLGALQVDAPDRPTAREGDQADALLSRRLDQFQARRNEKK